MKTRFVLFQGASSKQWYFHLKASNGKIICQSEGYNTKPSTLKGIASIKKNAAKAKIIMILHEWLKSLNNLFRSMNPDSMVVLRSSILELTLPSKCSSANSKASRRLLFSFSTLKDSFRFPGPLL